jgi:hypothetical protein
VSSPVPRTPPLGASPQTPSPGRAARAEDVMRSRIEFPSDKLRVAVARKAVEEHQ